MQNYTENRRRILDYENDPKYKLLSALRKSCYTENITHSTILEESYNYDDVWCPQTFDGFSCWDETPSSTTAFQTCPGFIIGFDPKRFAYKNTRSTKAQINYLCQYMAQNPDFAAGDFTTPRGAASMNLQWQRLKAALDELGPSKTVDQWRVAWRDQKAKARKEGGAVNKIIQATGNIGDVLELSENSSMVLSTIGAEMAVGCGPPESPVGVSGHIFEYGEVEVIMTPLSPAPLPPPPSPMSSTPPSPPMFSPLPPPPLFAMSLLSPPPLPVAPTHNAGSIPATRRRERVRKSHPPDRFLAAQMELNSLVKELVMQNAQHIQTQKELVQQLAIQNRLLRCAENGTWYVNPNNNKPWTNYTTCVDVEDLDFRTIINIIYVVGYSISVAALVLSLMIFLYFRSLQCTRIRIHMHLFTSFAVSNILWIVWYRVVVENVTVVQDNREWCQLLHIVTHYFMVASYFWMFCEGLHLHIALVVVFVKDEVAMRWFIALGWALSLLITVIYATARFYTPGATERCWIDHSDTIWIIVVPVGLSLLVSFVFLINVVRVLVTKLHPAPNQQASVAAKKAARAALILIPLFGLHFILLPLRPLSDSPGEKVYQVASALLTSLQGLCVAILFCFTNHDVMTATKAYLSRFRRANEAIAMTGVTGGESLMNTKDHVV